MNAHKPSRKFGLAVAQIGGIDLADSRASVVRRLLDMLREAHGRGAGFVVFPELALTTFFPRYWMPLEDVEARYFEKKMPNADVQPLFDEARRLGIGFYLGYAELTPEGKRYNTSILVDKSANIVGKYRKIHLPGHDDHKAGAPFQHLEKKYFDVGEDTWKVWNMDGIRTGMCLCNDRRWPETWRVMGLQSAELIVLGYNTPAHNIHWPEPVHLRMQSHLLSMQSGAYQNCVWAAAAGKTGFEDGFHLIGGSVIVSPAGEIVAQAATEEDEVITATIDLAMGENFRKNIFDFARHRRPEHYRLIVDRVGAGEAI
ncbi:N-carbamoyl-D-amino-acid hydrolase [Castellaniella denitrificans]|uniref:N-carbamoyl-D-amino-acid hydrolase n=1 Tax=Castellaniella denitrificans TaxID=56119 RepID=UPI00360A7637